MSTLTTDSAAGDFREPAASPGETRDTATNLRLKTKTVCVDALARVEGEGAFHVKVKDGKVEEAESAVLNLKLAQQMAEVRTCTPQP